MKGSLSLNLVMGSNAPKGFELRGLSQFGHPTDRPKNGLRSGGSTVRDGCAKNPAITRVLRVTVHGSRLPTHNPCARLSVTVTPRGYYW